MSEYDDIQTLKRTGCWPDCQVPEWAATLAEALGCPPPHAAVLQIGLEHEIVRLRFENTALRADNTALRLKNIRPSRPLERTQ